MSKLLLSVALALAVTLPLATASGPQINSGSGSGGGVRETRVEGTITAVNVAGGTVTIRTQGGGSVTVTTTAATKIERNGVRVTLAAFKIGDRGQARVTAGVTTKVEATGP